MSLTSTTADGTQIVTVNAERIDAAMAIQFKEDMRSTTENGPDRVILDLSEVKFIDFEWLGRHRCSDETAGPRSQTGSRRPHTDGGQGVSSDPHGYCL